MGVLAALAVQAELLAAAAATDTAPNVILISIDGLPADYFDNARVEMPTLHRMAREGARAESLLGVFPSVTWPNHTSVVTGVMPDRHGVVANRHYDRREGRFVELLWDPELDKSELVRMPTIYDLAHQAGLKTAGIAWPASRNAKHLDWQVPCSVEPELLERYTTPALRTELATLGLDVGKIAEWHKVDVGGKALWDWMYTRIARHVLQTHRPDLLLLHLEAVDALGHLVGRDSPEMYWACNQADHYLQELVAATESAGLAHRTTFFVVSDHGFLNYEKHININAVLHEAGLIEVAGVRVVGGRARAVTMGGAAGIYILDESDREAIACSLVERLQALEGVEAVILGEDLRAQGLPAPNAAAYAPDIMLSAAPGYAFSSRVPALAAITPTSGVKGAHGHLPARPEMHATFVAWGAAIKPGVTLGQVRTIDLAPTIAAILGVTLPDPDGRVVTEILR